MRKHNIMKRTLAGVLSVLTVAGYTMPANVDVLLTAGYGIVAHAENVGTWTSGACTVTLDSEGTLKINGAIATAMTGLWLTLKAARRREDEE